MKSHVKTLLSDFISLTLLVKKLRLLFGIVRSSSASIIIKHVILMGKVKVFSLQSSKGNCCNTQQEL